MMRLSLLALLAGLFWTAIVVLLLGLVTFSFPSLEEISNMIMPGLATSSLVTFIFRKRLSRREVLQDKTLPYRTLAVAVITWPCASYAVSIVCRLMVSQPIMAPLDGFWFTMLMSVFVGIGLGWPLTYHAAFLTQKVFGVFAEQKESNPSPEPSAPNGRG